MQRVQSPSHAKCDIQGFQAEAFVAADGASIMASRGVIVTGWRKLVHAQNRHDILKIFVPLEHNADGSCLLPLSEQTLTCMTLVP